MENVHTLVTARIKIVTSNSLHSRIYFEKKKTKKQIKQYLVS